MAPRKPVQQKKTPAKRAKKKPARKRTAKRITVKPRYSEETVRKYFRPPHYKTAVELQQAIIGYFEDKPEKIKKKVEVKGMDPVEIEVQYCTITGLALYLGFASRQSFYDYGEREEFSYTIARARLLIENTYERLLQDESKNAVFALQNFGWSTQAKIDESSSITITREIEHPAKKPVGAEVG